MKRLGISVLTIVFVIAIATGTAYALFSDTVQIQGVSISTGNADLKINNSDGPVDSGVTLSGLMPGDTKLGILSFKLSNQSTANIGLSLRAKLTSAGAELENFENKVLVRISNNEATESSDWKTLSEWNSGEITLNSTLLHSSSKDFVMDLKVDSTAGNSISGKSLDNMIFIITGEQVI